MAHPAGKYRHIGKLQSRVETQNETGEPAVTWMDFETEVRADIRYPGGLEAVKSDVPVTITRASIRIRYRPGVVATMRFVEDGGLTFDIKSVALDDTGKREIDLICETGQNHG